MKRRSKRCFQWLGRSSPTSSNLHCEFSAIPNPSRTVGPAFHRHLAFLINYLFICVIVCGSATRSYVRADELAKFVANDASPSGWFGISTALDGNTALIGANPLTPSNSNFGPGSAYIFRDGVSGWQQSIRLSPSDSRTGDRFGDAVDLSGDFAIIGAPTGSGAASHSGSAYVFQQSAPGVWFQAAKLTAPMPFDYDSFGTSVAMDGNTIVIGAAGDGAPIGGLGGSAYVFRRDLLGNWNRIATLKASDAETSDGFGYQGVGISGNKVIVGAYLDDNVAHEAGSAYIFEEDNSGQWNQTAKLIANDAVSFDWFGWSTDISGDTAVVGAIHGRDRFGAAYVFQQDGTSWVQKAKIATGVGTGGTVAIDDDLIVAGAITDDFGQFTGSAFAFRPDGSGNWQQVAKLMAHDAAAGDHFGNALSIYGDRVLIGAWVDDNQGGVDAGSAYLFQVPVPEPNTLLLTTIGCLSLVTRRRKPVFKYRAPPFSDVDTPNLYRRGCDRFAIIPICPHKTPFWTKCLSRL
jgi:hypothetical protein